MRIVWRKCDNIIFLTSSLAEYDKKSDNQNVKPAKYKAVNPLLTLLECG